MVNECRCKFNIGPTGDHTTGTGYFLYMDSSSPRQLLDRTRLAHANVFPAGRGVCTLRFYYNMYGSKLMGYLKVYLLTSGYSRWSEVWKTRGACYQNTLYASQLSASPRKFDVKYLTFPMATRMYSMETMLDSALAPVFWLGFTLLPIM